MRGTVNALVVVIIIVLLGALAVILYNTSSLVLNAPLLSSSTSTILTVPTSTVPFGQNGSSGYSNGSTTYSQNAIIEFALSEINSERVQFGLNPVSLSAEPSGPQHAQSMLYNDYFSHWDPVGMKPYMRYTLLGGNESVDENVAYLEEVDENCLGPICSLRHINVTNSIASMDYQMLYNDSLCCNNGHRNNTLNPNHNEVSIGVAYNDTNVYLVEDFVNDYIMWLNSTPGVYSNSATVYLNGMTLHNTTYAFTQINYDPLPQGMTNAQLGQTKSYDDGTAIAGVATGSNYYYQDVKTIYANPSTVRGDYFNIGFNMSPLISSYGAGVYTLDVFLKNSTGGEFSGTTYSIFINSSGEAYTPTAV